MATRGKKVEIYYTSQGTTTGVDSSALLFDGKNLAIITHGKTFKGTDTWEAATTSQKGYVPQLASGGGSIATQASEYVLTYKDGVDSTPTWKLLPTNAFLDTNDDTWIAADVNNAGYVPHSVKGKYLHANDSTGALEWVDDHTYTVNNNTFSIKSLVGSTTTTLSDFTANQGSDDDFTLVQGSNITFTNDATNRTLTIAGKAGTVTSVATGVGLTGGSITSSGTIKAKLKDETLNTADSTKSTSTNGGLYAVEADKSGNLAVRVPWTDHTYTVNNATYSIKSLVGSTTTTLSDFTANQSGNDDFTLAQGSNITFTVDTTNRKLTIAGTPNTWTAVSSTADGYVPKIGTAAAATIGTQSTEWVLTSTSGGTPSWRALPANAFKNDNTWKPANTTQEGYVPKSTANKILRSNNDGALYWGDDTNTWRPVGTGASDAAAGNHTHGISIAADSGTNQISLAAGTKYKLTAGGQSYIFTMPSDNNTTYSGSSTVTLTGTTFSLTKANVTTALGYTPPTTNSTYNFSGTTFRSGYSSAESHNCNDAWENGHYYYSSNGPATSIGASTSDGALYVQNYSSSWVGQIAQDYRNGRCFFRGKNNGSWTSWLTNIDSGNISSQNVSSAATWTTARTLTIGSTGKSVNGSGNVSWSLSEIGAAAASHSHSYLPLSGGTMTGSITLSQGSSARNVGIVGTYDYTKSAAIWAMGSSYQIPAAGNNLGSLYGAAYVYQGQAGQGTMAGGHQFVWAENGAAKVALGNSGVWTTGGFIKNGSNNNYALTGGGGHFAIHTGRNNSANALVRTDGNGYIQCGYINSSNGDENNNSSPARVWGTNGSDSYLRTYRTSALSVNYANSAGSVAWSNVTGKPFNWSGQSGQPSWLWGSNDGTNYYVWNPSNFSVNYANSAGSANSVAWGNVTGKPSTFTPSSHTHDYLPNTGGTISGPLEIKYEGISKGPKITSSGNSHIHFYGNNGNLQIGYLEAKTDGTLSWYPQITGSRQVFLSSVLHNYDPWSLEGGNEINMLPSSFNGSSAVQYWINYHAKGGSNTNGAVTYFVAGNGCASYARVRATAFDSMSDRGEKKNLKNINKTELEDLYQVASKLFKEFTWKRNNQDTYGLIAQEVQRYIPEACVFDDKTNVWTIDYQATYAKIMASIINEVNNFKEQMAEELNNIKDKLQTLLSDK